MKDEIASATISLTAVRGVNIINTAIHFLKALSLNNQGMTSGRTIGSKVPNQPADPAKSPLLAIRQGRIAGLKCFHRIVTCADFGRLHHRLGVASIDASDANATTNPTCGRRTNVRRSRILSSLTDEAEPFVNVTAR